MKAEEREELQQNDLATWMYRVPLFLKNYGSYLLLGVALLVLGWRLWDWHQANQAKELQDAWASLNDAMKPTYTNPPSKLHAIIDQASSKPLQAFAYAKIGKFYLDYLNMGAPADGLQGVKVSADQAAKESEEAFKKVISDYPDQTLALAEARLGLAALYENRGQWDDARKQYNAIVEKSSPLAGTAFADVAQRRLDHVDDWSKPAVLVATPTPLPEIPAVTPASQPATLPVTPATTPAASAPVK
jgi:tetratricopeptide (TPR) repeat protein